MQNIYERIPKYENSHFTMRLVSLMDCHDLLQVYSDKNAQRYFNSDNCHGDNFAYDSIERMKKSIEYWQEKYYHKDFVRLSIINRKNEKIIGTIELFNRQSTDYFTNCGILRIDLHSEYENYFVLNNILGLIMPSIYDDLECERVASKVVPEAICRAKILKGFGFIHTDAKLIGDDGVEYDSYYVAEKLFQL